jgi:RecA-family ATPase
MAKFALTIGTEVEEQKAKTFQQLLDDKDSFSRVIIPELMNVDHRVVITAKSGIGKSTLLKYIAMCAAQGIQPFRKQPFEKWGMDPIRCLAIDAENPIENITQHLKVVQQTLKQRVGDLYDEERFRIYRRPGGMNIRSRRDRVDLQREIALHAPDLVVVGPIYKITRRSPKESWEEATGEFLAIWDDLRTKYEFGVIFESHVSKGTEDWTPQGSILLTQWAEVGLALQTKKSSPNQIFVERFRGDRLSNLHWPTELFINKPDWVFEATWR